MQVWKQRAWVGPCHPNILAAAPVSSGSHAAAAAPSAAPQSCSAALRGLQVACTTVTQLLTSSVCVFAPPNRCRRRGHPRVVCLQVCGGGAARVDCAGGGGHQQQRQQLSGSPPAPGLPAGTPPLSLRCLCSTVLDSLLFSGPTPCPPLQNRHTLPSACPFVIRHPAPHCHACLATHPSFLNPIACSSWSSAAALATAQCASLASEGHKRACRAEQLQARLPWYPTKTGV